MLCDKLILGSGYMIYPEFIRERDIIGVSAPSAGLTEPLRINTLNNAVKKFEEKGYKILLTPNVRKNEDGVSSSATIRSLELASLYQNKDVKAIICAKGGEFLVEMLSCFDFSVVQKNIKWLQGYSDPTGLLFTITTNLDIATIYGSNFAGFGMDTWHESLENNLDILEGKLMMQKSFARYESMRVDMVTGREGYHLDTPVYWKILNQEKEVSFKGRIIGGCIDIITELFGTRFDKTKEFIEKYKGDGIIWYFDNCELSMEDMVRTLWKFKDNGWFQYTTGIIFGRSATNYSNMGITLEDALNRVLGDLDLPIILDTDIGHVPPRMTIINGAYTMVYCKDGKGTLEFQLK